MENQALLTSLLPSSDIGIGYDESAAGIKVENGNINGAAAAVKAVKVAAKVPKRKASDRNKKDCVVATILDQDNDNVIDFFENVDPMLAWALLKSKILPEVGCFDLLAERAKLKQTTESGSAANVVRSLLDELDTLIGEVIHMLQTCCHVLDPGSCQASSSSFSNSIQLSQGLSFQLFGTANCQSTICPKTIEDFPAMYKEKMFKHTTLPQDLKPFDLPADHVKTEQAILADHKHDLVDENQILAELGLNDEDCAVEEEEEELEEEEDLDDEDNDEDFKLSESQTIKNQEIKKRGSSSGKKQREPQTCEKCHKTYNTQTQFKIHQRDAWRCPGKPEPKWLRIVKGKDYYCLHPDCSPDGVNGPLFPRRNKYWHHLREKHWTSDNRESFAFDCTYCPEKFPFYDMQRQHIKQYHEKAVSRKIPKKKI